MKNNIISILIYVFYFYNIKIMMTYLFNDWDNETLVNSSVQNYNVLEELIKNFQKEIMKERWLEEKEETYEYYDLFDLADYITNKWYEFDVIQADTNIDLYI